MKNIPLKKITVCAILSALSVITFIIENLFPPIIIPGAKMGLSNVFILISAIILGSGYGFITLFIKVTLGSLFSGNFSAIIYSFPAGALALSIELIILTFIKKTSIIATSVAGAVSNITIQNLIFCFYTNTLGYLIYLPYLTLIGVIGGIITGLTVYFILKRLPNDILHIKENQRSEEN